MADTALGAIARMLVRMFQSDDSLETYVAVVILTVVGFIVWANISRSVPNSG